MPALPTESEVAATHDSHRYLSRACIGHKFRTNVSLLLLLLLVTIRTLLAQT